MAVSSSDLALCRTRHAVDVFLAVERGNVLAQGGVAGLHAHTVNDIVTVAPVGALCGRNFLVRFGTAVGSDDIGVTRLRYNTAAAVALVQIASHGFNIPAGSFYTILDILRPWAIRPDIENVLEDEDHAFTTDAARSFPLVRMGSHVFRFLSPGGWADVVYQGSSQAFDGAALGARSWGFDGSTTPGPIAGAGPHTIRYVNPGEFLTRLTVTGGAGGTSRGYRKVFIVDRNSPDLIRNVSIDAMTGSLDSGDWQATITTYCENVGVDTFPEGALVVVAVDTYWGSEQEHHNVDFLMENRGEILMTGFVVENSVSQNAELGTVTFQIGSATYVAKNLTAWGANFSTGTADWHVWPGATFGDYLHHLLCEHSTLAYLSDCYINPLIKDLTLREVSFGEGTIFDQLEHQIGEACRATVIGTRLGEIIISPYAQWRLIADRTSEVMFTLEHQDWRDDLEFDFIDQPAVSQVDSLGFQQNLTARGALAPPVQLHNGGSIQKSPVIRVADSAEMVSYGEVFGGYYTGLTKSIHIPLSYSWPLWDTGPQRYITLDLDTTDTTRELDWDNVNCLVKEISYTFNHKAGTIFADIVVERESGLTEAIANDPAHNNPWDDGPPAPPPMPPGPIQPPGIPSHYGIILLSQSQLARSFDFFEVEDPSWVDISDGLTGTYYHMTINQVAGTQAYCTTSAGVFYCGNFLDQSPIWHCILTAADAVIAAGYAHNLMGITLGMDGTVWSGCSFGGWFQGGYFSGNAGGLAYAAFPACSGRITRTSASSYGAHCLTSGSIRFNARRGVPNIAIYLDDLGCVDSNDYEGAACESADSFILNNRLADGLNYVYRTPATLTGWPVAGPMGLDELAGSCLYYGSVPPGVYRDGNRLATAPAVFSGAVRAGRAIFSRKPIGSPNEIVWVAAIPAAAPDAIVVWTVDSFTNFLDKTGDFRAVFGNWAGGSGSSEANGNCQVLCFEYRIQSGGF